MALPAAFLSAAPAMERRQLPTTVREGEREWIVGMKGDLRPGTRESEAPTAHGLLCKRG